MRARGRRCVVRGSVCLCVCVFYLICCNKSYKRVTGLHLYLAPQLLEPCISIFCSLYLLFWYLMQSTSTPSPSNPTPPAEFEKIIQDFVADLLLTFPELAPSIRKWWSMETGVSEKRRQMEVQIVFRHCVRVYPEQFFDILYKNAEIFAQTPNRPNSDEYLPGIHFSQLWSEPLGEGTRNAIWNYLQLVLMSVSGAISSQSNFGDTSKLFEAIDENELKEKLTETMSEIEKLFQENEEKQKKKDKERRRRERFRNMYLNKHRAESAGENKSEKELEMEAEADWERKVEEMLDGEDSEADSDEEEGGFGAGMFKNMLPDVNKLHEHLQGIMNGKLGKLAVEIADETARELEIDLADVMGGDEGEGAGAGTDAGGKKGSTTEKEKAKELFKKLMANPDKLKKLVASMGAKIGKKIEDGELTQSEIMEEAAQITEKMKDLPGMETMTKMMASMGMKIGKSGMGQMTTHLKRESKMSKLKERIRQRADQKVAQERLNDMLQSLPVTTAASGGAALSDEKLAELFSKSSKGGNGGGGDKGKNKKKKAVAAK